MATKVIMPQLGESVVEGTVIEWLKSEGDRVEEYEPIVVIGTDKVDSEVPSPAAGVLLKIYVQQDQTVEAGVLLALIGEPGEKLPDEAETAPAAAHKTNGAAVQPVGAAVSRAAAQPDGGRYTGHVTPVVARMAAQHDLDLGQIQGTGRGGRITKKDVEAYLEAGGQAGTTAKEELPPWEQPGSGDLFKSTVDYEEDTPPATAPAAAAAPARPAPAPTAVPSGVPGELARLSTMRRSIAEHMVRSKLHTSPHVTTVFEIDLSAVLAHRAAHRADFERRGVRLTLTPYFVAACAVALREFPYVNSQWTDEGIFLHHAAHIGVAVAIDDGLIVPVIKNAQDYNLMGLARAVNDLAERARSRQLRPDEVQGGTFTITNHGVSGSLFAMPIINQPQAAILGVGMLEKRVRVVSDAIAIRPCAYFSLTFDHRMIDGATGDGFLAAVKRELEGWPG